MLLTLHHFVNLRHKRIRAGSRALRQGNDLGILPVHFCLLLSCLCEPPKFLWFLWPTDETLSREEAKCVPSDSPPPLLGCRHRAEDTELSPVVLESMTSPPSLVPGLIQAFLGGRVLPRRSGDSNQVLVSAQPWVLRRWELVDSSAGQGCFPTRAGRDRAWALLQEGWATFYGCCLFCWTGAKVT